MSRWVIAMLLAGVALVAAPVVATVVTISSLASATHPLATVSILRVDAAVLAWGGAGGLGLIAMVAFGVAAIRRPAPPSVPASLPTPEPTVEVPSAGYA